MSEVPVCQHCGSCHPGACPRIKAMEYHLNGTVKRVEYHSPDVMTKVERLTPIKIIGFDEILD
jgi:hypothetical protein